MKHEIYSRELSWLQFNARVLQEAKDKSVPLLQRLRFLGIFSNNQDEFIKVRIANLVRYNEQNKKQPIKLTGGYKPAELLKEANLSIGASQRIFREAYSEILSELETHNIYMVSEKDLTPEQIEFCREYYLSVVSVRLVPLLLRHNFVLPFLPDDKVYLAVKMNNNRTNKYAILQVPTSDACPRFVVLPSNNGRTDIIFLDDIIRLFLDDIFFMFNYKKISAHTFKVVRDAELTLDDDVSKSLTAKMSHGITQREKGRPIRFVYDKEMPEDILNTITKKLNIKDKSMIEGGGRYHLLRDLMRFPKVNRSLEMHNPKPLNHHLIDPFDSVFKVIKRQDILLCYPYQTFNHFIDMLREAAVDPRVQSISISLYRTAKHSKVVNALINAAKNGKQVNVLVELKARFDEEHNIFSSDALQNAGVRVIHSPEGLKVHSKLVLIERMEGSAGLRGYVYVGTGNFNESTTSIYSDFGYFTANQQVADDARAVFNYLDSPHKHHRYKKLLVSPLYLREQIEEIIENEIKEAKKGRRAFFYGKFNSLTDEGIIELLYKASNAGVKIRLLVRGACCLIPGIDGMSDNIEVRSIVDRYLEHARMIIVCNGGKLQSYILSADLMTRNLDRRVEVGIQIASKNIHITLCDYFNIQWNDNVKAREITPPFNNGYVLETNEPRGYRCQQILYDYFIKY